MEKTYNFNLKFPGNLTVKWHCKAASEREAREKASQFMERFGSELVREHGRDIETFFLTRSVRANPDA